MMPVTREEATLLADLRRRRATGQKDATLSGVGIQNQWAWAESLKKQKSKRSLVPAQSAVKPHKGQRVGASTSSRPRKPAQPKPQVPVAPHLTDEKFVVAKADVSLVPSSDTAQNGSPISSFPPTPPNTGSITGGISPVIPPLPTQYGLSQKTSCPYKLQTEVDMSRFRMSVMVPELHEADTRRKVEKAAAATATESRVHEWQQSTIGAKSDAIELEA